MSYSVKYPFFISMSSLKIVKSVGIAFFLLYSAFLCIEFSNFFSIALLSRHSSLCVGVWQLIFFNNEQQLFQAPRTFAILKTSRTKLVVWKGCYTFCGLGLYMWKYLFGICRLLHQCIHNSVRVQILYLLLVSLRLQPKLRLGQDVV